MLIFDVIKIAFIFFITYIIFRDVQIQLSMLQWSFLIILSFILYYFIDQTIAILYVCTLLAMALLLHKKHNNHSQ